jgi:transcriptional regulator with XRE-family HTH domain
MKPDPLPAFAGNVRARQKALTLTQKEAAYRALMNMSYWSRTERGVVDPGTRMVTRVATALETTPAALMAGVGSDALDAHPGRRVSEAPGESAVSAFSDDLATPSSAVPWPPFSPARLRLGRRVLPTNYSTSRAPARPTPTHPALPPINLIAFLLTPTTPPASSSVPPTT